VRAVPPPLTAPLLLYCSFPAPSLCPSGPIYFVSSSVAAALPKPNDSLVIYRLEDVYLGHQLAALPFPLVSFWHVPKLILEATDRRQADLIALHNVRAPHSMLDAHSLYDLDLRRGRRTQRKS
jgi:hypothetical protein